MMKKILINFVHPAKHKSKLNMTLRHSVEKLEAVTINDLYANYPDFLIDVEAEQKLCEEHDIIIFQFPFYWYSTPSILKEWQDLVLEYGWAYGSKGKALEGKKFMLALTAGIDDDGYSREGCNYYTIEELTSPLKAMSKLCNMTWISPFAVLGIHRGLSQDKIDVYADDYKKVIEALRDELVDYNKAAEYIYINTDLDSIIRRG